MSQKQQALDSLVKIQVLLGELGFTLMQDGYFKDYGTVNGSVVRIAPIFDRGLSLDLQYNLSALCVTGQETITIERGQPVALDRVPSEARTDVMRMLAELSPGALLPKTETFIMIMTCSSCADVVSSYFVNEGEVKCLKCLKYE